MVRPAIPAPLANVSNCCNGMHARLTILQFLILAYPVWPYSKNSGRYEKRSMETHSRSVPFFWRACFEILVVRYVSGMAKGIWRVAGRRADEGKESTVAKHCISARKEDSLLNSALHISLLSTSGSFFMSPQHLVLSCKANWSEQNPLHNYSPYSLFLAGHLRSLCILATRLAASQAVTITIVVANNEGVITRVIQEVGRGLTEEAAVDGANIRYGLTHLSDRKGSHHVEITHRFVGLSPTSKDGTSLDDEFRLVWRDLMSEKAVTSDHQPAPVAATMKPSAVVLDVT